MRGERQEVKGEGIECERGEAGERGGAGCERGGDRM